ncbi:MAG: hypothetical protein QM655_04240 [Nocardioidaceae bacterium]
MSSSVIDRDLLTEELRRAGMTADPDAFLAVLRRAVHTTAAVPAEAQELMTEAGVDPHLLDPEGIDKGRLAITYKASAAQQESYTKSMTTKEAAKRLNTADSNIRRSIASGHLYSAGRDGRHGHRLPLWQFPHDKPLPHLAELLTALPSDLHPLEVESFFTTPSDTLNQMTPVEWLATGGDVAPVLALADDEAHR